MGQIDHLIEVTNPYWKISLWDLIFIELIWLTYLWLLKSILKHLKAYESNKEVNATSSLYCEQHNIENETDFKINFKTNFDLKDKSYRHYRKKDVFFQMIRILLGFLSCFTVFLLSIYGRYFIWNLYSKNNI